MLLNKVDLLPHLSFDVERCIANARQVHPAIEVIEISATSGEGMLNAIAKHGSTWDSTMHMA